MVGLSIHEAFLTRFPERDLVVAVRGDYDYYHYLRDGVDDRGWGCGYRTLQTLASWILLNVEIQNSRDRVPSISRIQETIAKLDDTKSNQFVGSKEWIGCYEMFLVLDGLFGVACRLVHCRSGGELGNHVDSIVEHLKTRGAPIPIGGDQDCSSKAIFGVRKTRSGFSFLIVDPHLAAASKNGKTVNESDGFGKCDDYSEAIDGKFVRWMDSNEFDHSSFYNLCFPIV